MKTPTILTVAIVGALAFVIGRYTADEKAPAHMAIAPAPPPERPSSSSAPIRLQVVGSCTDKTAAAPQPAIEPSNEPSADQLAARDRAFAVIDTAVTTGRWTEADRNQLHVLLASAGPLVDDVYGHLLPEFNAGHLNPEVFPPL